MFTTLGRTQVEDGRAPVKKISTARKLLTANCNRGECTVCALCCQTSSIRVTEAQCAECVHREGCFPGPKTPTKNCNRGECNVCASCCETSKINLTEAQCVECVDNKAPGEGCNPRPKILPKPTSEREQPKSKGKAFFIQLFFPSMGCFYLGGAYFNTLGGVMLGLMLFSCLLGGEKCGRRRTPLADDGCDGQLKNKAPQNANFFEQCFAEFVDQLCCRPWRELFSFMKIMLVCGPTLVWYILCLVEILRAGK